MVQGHVDGVGDDRGPQAPATLGGRGFPLPADLARYVVEKGSITVDGISLTVAGVADETFAVGLIPTTLALTTLGTRRSATWSTWRST